MSWPARPDDHRLRTARICWSSPQWPQPSAGNKKALERDSQGLFSGAGHLFRADWSGLLWWWRGGDPQISRKPLIFMCFSDTRFELLPRFLQPISYPASLQASTRKKASGSGWPADRVAAAGRRWPGSRRARRRGRLSPPAFGLGLTAHFWCRMTPSHSAARCRCSYCPYPLTFKNRGELGADVTMRRNSLISLIKFFRICPHSGGESGGEWLGE